MNDILITDSQDNMGGLSTLLFSPVENVATIPGVIGLLLQGLPTLTEGSRWYTLQGTIETAGLGVPTAKSINGDQWNPKVTTKVPKLTIDNEATLAEMQGRLFIVIVKDHNGNARLLGTLDGPLDFSYGANTGIKTGDTNGATITFDGEMGTAPPYIG